MTMTRVCLTGWNSNTDDSRITSRRIPRNSFPLLNPDVVQAGEHLPTSQRLVSAAGLLRHRGRWSLTMCWVLKDDGRHCWGMLGSCTLMARTEALRALVALMADFVAAPN